MVDCDFRKSKTFCSVISSSSECRRPERWSWVQTSPTGRPLRRAIQRLVEDPLSERILWKEFRAGETVVVDVEDDQVAFRSIEGIEPPPVEPVASGSEG